VADPEVLAVPKVVAGLVEVVELGVTAVAAPEPVGPVPVQPEVVWGSCVANRGKDVGDVVSPPSVRVSPGVASPSGALPLRALLSPVVSI